MDTVSVIMERAIYRALCNMFNFSQQKVLSSSTHLEKHSNYKQVADVLGPNTLIASPGNARN
jgi:hypothetical protein